MHDHAAELAALIRIVHRLHKLRNNRLGCRIATLDPWIDLYIVSRPKTDKAEIQQIGQETTQPTQDRQQRSCTRERDHLREAGSQSDTGEEMRDTFHFLARQLQIECGRLGIAGDKLRVGD
jgi:hypothetical protein